MQDLYKLLLLELPRIAKAIEVFPEAQRNKAFDMLVEALKTSNGFNSTIEPEKVEVAKNILKNKIQEVAIEVNRNSVETEASKKLSKLRAKIFEKTTAASLEETEDDPVKAGLDELSTQDLSNIVFYQKGRSTPLSDML